MLTLLAGVLWTLRRLHRLETRGAPTPGVSIEGAAEISLGEWVRWMRNGEWGGPALSLLLAFLGMLGTVYGGGALAIALALEGGSRVTAAAVLLGLVWLTLNLVRAARRAARHRAS